MYPGQRYLNKLIRWQLAIPLNNEYETKLKNLLAECLTDGQRNLAGTPQKVWQLYSTRGTTHTGVNHLWTRPRIFPHTSTLALSIRADHKRSRCNFKFILVAIFSAEVSPNDCRGSRVALCHMAGGHNQSADVELSLCVCVRECVRGRTQWSGFNYSWAIVNKPGCFFFGFLVVIIEHEIVIVLKLELISLHNLWAHIISHSNSVVSFQIETFCGY